METEVPHEMEMEGGSGDLTVMGQQSRCSDRSVESVKVAGGKSAMDQVVMGNDTLQQEHAEEPTELVPDNALPESKLSENSAGSGGSFTREAEAAIELAKRFHKTRITPEMDLYDEILRALLHFQTSKNMKIDEETLQLLKDMSNKLAKKDEEDLDHDDSAKSATPGAKKTLEEEMADEAERFRSHRRLWKYKWRKTCGSFTDLTLLSSMQFTHYMPGRGPYSTDCTTTETLQIVSIKLTGLAGGLELPLSVYGVVAVRDMVDHNRNILFCLDRYQAQELKQNDPFLHLTGPSRAIVFKDKVWIEIELKVKGLPQDEDLISCARCYYTGVDSPGASTICFKNALCTLEVCLEPVQKTAQATILGVHVVKGGEPWPFQHGGLVGCSPRPGKFVLSDSRLTRKISPSSSKIVLIQSKDEAMPKGENGHVLLWRQVVSVNLEGRLDVVIKAYSKDGDIAAETSVSFYPKVCNINVKKCLLGDAEVVITVAWSLVAMSKLSGNSAGSGGSFIQEEAENEFGKRFEMTRITPERHLYAEIQTDLFDFQYELTTKSRKIDKETLQLLKDMSRKLAKKDEEDLDHDSDNSDTTKTPEEEMADEAERFTSYRRFWEYKHRRTCGSFTNITVLSSMQFTHYTPGREPYSMGTTNPETLQIVSMKLTGLAGGLKLPLSVYGVVAVRDMVDRNRNILFYLNRSKAQELKQDDPFLHLTGPSRAILFTGKVWIEVELKVKDSQDKDSQDKDLISCARCYYTGEGGPGVSTICFKSALCTLELCLEPVKKTVQATILGVHVVKGGGSWPFQYGGLIACSPQVGRRVSPSSSQIVLIESKDGSIPKAEDRHVLLRRQVVSVNLKGRLDVVIKAYSKSGDIAAETSVPFYPKVCNVSKKKCLFGDAEVAITVAWSLVATDLTELWLELTG